MYLWCSTNILTKIAALIKPIVFKLLQYFFYEEAVQNGSLSVSYVLSYCLGVCSWVCKYIVVKLLLVVRSMCFYIKQLVNLKHQRAASEPKMSFVFRKSSFETEIKEPK